MKRGQNKRVVNEKWRIENWKKNAKAVPHLTKKTAGRDLEDERRRAMKASAGENTSLRFGARTNTKNQKHRTRPLDLDTKIGGQGKSRKKRDGHRINYSICRGENKTLTFDINGNELYGSS